MFRKILTLFLLLTAFLIQSQSYIYKEFGLNEGLPSSQVYNIYQDKNGIIWFATDRGIANYNGYEFKQFGINDGVINNVILDFHPQKNGDIYCTTFDNQLFYFNENFNGFTPYKYNNILSKYLKNHQPISNLFIDQKNGNLNISCESMHGKLVISKNGTVLKPENTNAYKNTKIMYTVFENNPEGLFYYTSKTPIETDTKKFNSIKNVDQNKIEVITIQNGNFYIYKTSNEVTIYNKDGEILKTIKNKFNPLTVKPLNGEHFFIGYLFGGGSIINLKGEETAHFLKNKSITNFLIDHEGGYWFSTLHSGVFYIKEPKIRICNQTPLDEPINAITKTNKNELLIGFNDGKITQIDPKGKAKILYEKVNNSKAFVEYDSKKNKLFLKFSESLIIDQIKKKTFNILGYVLKISEPNEKGLLISQINKVSLFDKENNFKDISILPFRVHDACFYNDAIYLGTPKGAYVLNGTKLTDLKTKNDLYQHRIDDIDYNELRNELYFATLGNGLIVNNKNTNKSFSISKKNGLLSDIVNEVYIENKNEIWVCTNSGINKIKFLDNYNYEITGFKSSNGLLNDGISDVEVKNDTVWIASKKGLVYAPKAIFEPNKNNKKYFIKITSVTINDSIGSLQELNDLSYDENRIEISYEGISFKNSNELIYKYKLEGLDKKWYYTSNRKINYTSLPSGNYMFKIAVVTSKEDSVTNYLEVPITIHEAFWKNNWFIGMIILLLATIIYLFFKIRVFTYNTDITRELIRLVIKKIKKKEKYFVFKEAGKEIRIKTNTILYVKSAGNYIDLFTENKNYTIRCKIGEFIDSTPDPLEYLRIHRSYIIRIDKVDIKSKNEVVINGDKIPVSSSFECEINKLIF